MKLTSEFIDRALGTKALITGTSEFKNVTTDSRKAENGSLFVALPGEKFDGHTFVESVLNAGGAGFIVNMKQCGDKFRTLASEKKVTVWDVEKPLDAYRKLAAAWRKRFSIPVICVAGSTGKTTTKEFLAALLTGKYKNVLKTLKSQNGFIGIPMTLLELSDQHDCAVIEVGIDDQGAMKQHLPVVSATHSLLTTIGPEHLERLKDVETVAKEESYAITDVLTSGGKVALSLDDRYIAKLYNPAKKAQQLTYSLKSAADIQGSIDSQTGDLKVGGLKLIVPLAGEHNAANLLAAVAMARLVGLTDAEIANGLKNFVPAEGRSEVRELRGAQFLCDYYNANPTSMNAAFDLLASLKKGKAWVCLADMGELGTFEEQMHRDLSQKILKYGFDHVLLFGTRMKWLEDELKRKKYNGEIQHFSSHNMLAKHLREKLQRGDSVLIKGSRSQKMEEVWKALQ